SEENAEQRLVSWIRNCREARTRRFQIAHSNSTTTTDAFLGPGPYDGGHLFIAAFSRERVAPFSTPRHQYESYDRACDDFAQRLDAKDRLSHCWLCRPRQRHRRRSAD